MKTRPLLFPAMLAAIVLVILAAVVARGASLAPLAIYPVPPKAQSPRAASSPDRLNKAMAVQVVVAPVVNTGHVQADFEATKIQGLTAGFKYCTQVGSWKILGTTSYPTNGGTVSMNFSGTNLPALYFKGFFQFSDPIP